MSDLQSFDNDHSPLSVDARLAQHLAQWGLREFFQERDYYAWQKQSLSPEVLQHLNELAEQRQGGLDSESDREFYDLASSSMVLPVLYSQRFGYYRTVGAAISQRLEPGTSVLDFGCGVGILTTWYASMFPGSVFIGVDRSRQSIEVARQRAKAMNLQNVSFYSCVVPQDQPSETFDVIISSQALFQSESDPGIPSQSWESFQREDDPEHQRGYETPTGIGERLDWLLARLNPLGRLLAFEKAYHLGRRVLLQRAFAARGLSCDQEHVFLRYASLDEYELDGPLYSLTVNPTTIAFDEKPLVNPIERVYRSQGRNADWVWAKISEHGSLDQPEEARWGDYEIQWQLCRTAAGVLCGRFLVPNVFAGVLVGFYEDEEFIKSLFDDVLKAGRSGKTPQEMVRETWTIEESFETQWIPLYENHSASAEEVWRGLIERAVQRETTQEGLGGQQYHVELGHCAGQLAYLYWANTFDQRQLVIMEVERQHILEEYFSESGVDGD
ncbi:MAG: methyltransferase domain-containing protein [Nitrospirae bacterium]|nr:methyltransferase domain-containing protein [Nitrospirota bacterium]MDA1304537.1 methyltransferase domain-containing protein [Nitrospirota bacterium]